MDCPQPGIWPLLNLRTLVLLLVFCLTQFLNQVDLLWSSKNPGSGAEWPEWEEVGDMGDRNQSLIDPCPLQFEMLTGSLPFQGKDRKETMTLILK